MAKRQGSTGDGGIVAAGIVMLLLFAAFVYGWVVNLIWVIQQDITWTTEQAVSVIGIFLGPLGAIMGWMH